MARRIKRIYRENNHETNFTIIDNDVISDSNLDFDARGVLMYLLSKPDFWKVRINDIMNNGNIGKSKAYKIITKLCENYYIKKINVKNNKGRYTELIYLVYEIPNKSEINLEDIPYSDLPEPDTP